MIPNWPCARRSRSAAAVALATILAALGGCGGAGGDSPAYTPPASANPAVTTPSTRTSASRGTIAAAVWSDQALALALLGRLGESGGNVVFSPYSIESALAMIAVGAGGSTAGEIDHVLNTTSPGTLAAALARLDVSLAAGSSSSQGPRLQVANTLWVQSGLALEEPFTHTLSTLFGASPQTVNFAGAPESARQAINSWVAAHTGHQITGLFPPGSIPTQTSAVLANAIYLAAHWADPFTRARTAPGPFYTAAGATVQVPLMTQTPVAVRYARRDDYQAVDLPYAHSNLSMLLVMPTPGTLASFRRGLSAGSLAQLEQTLSWRRVELHVPRFHLSFDTELNPVLSALGMPAAFTDAADLSGIAAHTALKMSAVEHAADLQVDEEGTVAAATTGVGLQPTAVTPTPATRLIVDHPFLVLLRDAVTKTILFVAQVTKPA